MDLPIRTCNTGPRLRRCQGPRFRQARSVGLVIAGLKNHKLCARRRRRPLSVCRRFIWRGCPLSNWQGPAISRQRAIIPITHFNVTWSFCYLSFRIRGGQRCMQVDAPQDQKCQKSCSRTCADYVADCDADRGAPQTVQIAHWTLAAVRACFHLV